VATTTYPSSAYPAPHYPVHVVADDTPLASRWLWVVKWLLALPHYVVLVFLWAAFVVLSLVALVAILVTGRYPRAIFDFNVGVLRWSWRVAYYAYGALATDRYPPFTLAEVDDYPAHLEVEYPERLSRGLVLLKWWLLAIPHYIVVGVFLGTGTWAVRQAEDWRLVWGGGLVGILVLVAAVVLAVTGGYPRTVYDLLLGLNRWVLRVAAYAGLMTDQYPPFRLDLGPQEPDDAIVLPRAGAGAAVPATGPAAPPAPATTPSRRTGWSAGRVVSVVAGSTLALAALGLLVGGGALVVADRTMRDGGYLTGVPRHVSSTGYAVVVGDVMLEGPGPDGAFPARAIGDLRFRVTPDDASAPVFVGIAPDADVDAFLAGVARTVPGENAGTDRTIAGTAPAAPPRTQSIWDVQSVGTGERELVWTPREGRWSMVLMNADGAAGVAADVDVGATVPWLDGVGTAVLGTGFVVLAAGVVLVAVAVRRASRRPTA
jgi:hypothetical protein